MSSDCNFYVFREGRRTTDAQQLLFELRQNLSRAADESGWTDALLRSGELECGLEDARHPSSAAIAAITDFCARRLVRREYEKSGEEGFQWPESLAIEVSVSNPEGFAYYALHPRQYADVVSELPAPSALVIGIRSIGTTLSAVTAAAFENRGIRTERFPVRPQGHPFERELRWSNEELERVRRAQRENRLFVIVDEGPGLSGSSFLAVAEALCGAGVPAECIVLIPSHSVDATKLRARDAAARWNRFRCASLPHAKYPAGDWIGAGEWRHRFGGDPESWPPAWTHLEAAKFVSADCFWKFEGLGPYGTRAREIAEAVGENGFSPRVVATENGYIGYELVHGHPCTARDLTATRIEQIAAYCAFRVANFSVSVDARSNEELAHMVRVNYEREFGVALAEERSTLPVVHGTICDAKMEPHEWLVAEDGRFLKVDATSHGDGHFFPGPCDIAWDLAGVIVEWEMDQNARESFLHAYATRAGDDASERISSYLTAYATFRGAHARMAAAGMRGSTDEERFTLQANRYRDYLERTLRADATAVPAARLA